MVGEDIEVVVTDQNPNYQTNFFCSFNSRIVSLPIKPLNRINLVDSRNCNNLVELDSIVQNYTVVDYVV